MTNKQWGILVAAGVILVIAALLILLSTQAPTDIAPSSQDESSQGAQSVSEHAFDLTLDNAEVIDGKVPQENLPSGVSNSETRENNPPNDQLQFGSSVQSVPLSDNVAISRTPEQIEQLNRELELWEVMMSSEYIGYSHKTLVTLAEQGDPVAFHQLIANGELAVDDIQRLAKQLTAQGYPMTYGFAADGIFGSTKDKILAMAYYIAAVESGSELMRQFELDYQVWFKLEQEELALAEELAAELSRR